MKVQLEELSPTSRKLTIEVDAAAVEQELARSYRQLSQRVTVPGFRSGKIPRRLLERRHRQEVEAEVLRRVQVMAFMEAAAAEKVDFVGEPAVSGGAIVPQQPLSFTAVVDVRPKVSVHGYRELPLKRPDDTVTEAQVEEQLERLRDSKATWVPVVDREVAASGDSVVIDFEATFEDKPFPGSTSRDVEVSVSPGELIDGHQPALEGVAIGGKATFDYTFPADFRIEAVAGKTARCVSTLKAIKARAVPTLDDDFARSVGAESLEALRASVRKDLERAARQRSQSEERDAIVKALVERNPFDLPAAMVASGIDTLLEALVGNVAANGVDPRELKLDWARLREELRPRAELEVRGQLLLKALCDQEHLDVSDEEVEKHILELSESVRLPPAAVRKQFAGAKGRANLVYRLLEAKALDFVRAQARYEA